MNCSEIIRILQNLAPEEIACDWDNVGLLLGRSDKSVSKILIALELTDDVTEQAINMSADLVITHHPLIFRPLKNVCGDDFIGRRVMKLLSRDISYYAMHTNFDRAEKGMGTLAADRLDLRGQRFLADLVTYQNAAGKTVSGGIGKIGSLRNALNLDALCDLIDGEFRNEGIRVFVSGEKRGALISEVAIVPGSGGEYVKAAADNGADVLITGDVSHHTGADAVSQGMTVIDVGHYCLEYPFEEYVERYLQEYVSSDIEIETAVYQPPYYMAEEKHDKHIL